MEKKIGMGGTAVQTEDEGDEESMSELGKKRAN